MPPIRLTVTRLCSSGLLECVCRPDKEGLKKCSKPKGETIKGTVDGAVKHTVTFRSQPHEGGERKERPTLVPSRSLTGDVSNELPSHIHNLSKLHTDGSGNTACTGYVRPMLGGVSICIPLFTTPYVTGRVEPSPCVLL